MFNLEIDNLAKKPYIPQKNYFYEFVAYVLHDDIVILSLTSMEAVKRPNTIHWPHTLALWDGTNVELKCQSVRSLYGVWPLTASIEVITQDIGNKFIKEIFLWDVWFHGQIVCSKNGFKAKSSVPRCLLLIRRWIALLETKIFFDLFKTLHTICKMKKS